MQLTLNLKIETEEDSDIFKVEEEQRRKKKEESENVEAVEDEEVSIDYQKLEIFYLICKFRFQPEPHSGARLT